MSKKKTKLFKINFSAAGMVSLMIFAASLLMIATALIIAFRSYGHGDNVIGGLGAAVAEVLVQNKSVPTEFVGVQDTFGHSASPAELLKHYGLTPENIAEKAKKAISRK